jgi:hypothetical protein
MLTSASSKSKGTQKNLASGLTRLSTEAIPVLRLAKECATGIGTPGPEATLGSVLAVAEMIRVCDFVLYTEWKALSSDTYVPGYAVQQGQSSQAETTSGGINQD